MNKAKTKEIIETAKEVLIAENPMTVRQVYYQLVSKQIIKNCKALYNSTSRILVDARQKGIIDWDWIEDRTRKPHVVSMWSDMKTDFIRTIKQAYKRDVWPNQENYVEVWLEKDALSGLFVEILEPLGITLNVGRGYDGWSSIRNAALRLNCKEQEGHVNHVLYFGDMDPSGVSIYESLIERLKYFNVNANFVKCALTKEQIEEYNLPSDPSKKKDTRTKDFVKKYGDISVELDALPVNVLKGILSTNVKALLNLERLEETTKLEQTEIQVLTNALNSLKD